MILEVKSQPGFETEAIFEDVSLPNSLRVSTYRLVGANRWGKINLYEYCDRVKCCRMKVGWVVKYVTAGYLDNMLFWNKNLVHDVLRLWLELSRPRLMWNLRAWLRVDALIRRSGRAAGPLERAEIFILLDIRLTRCTGSERHGLRPWRVMTELSGGQRTKDFSWQSCWKNNYPAFLGRPTNYLDTEHIDWLKRYRIWKMPLIWSRATCSLSEWWQSYRLPCGKSALVNYSGITIQFQEVYEMKSQLEAASERQQKEIADLKDFVAHQQSPCGYP